MSQYIARYWQIGGTVYQLSNIIGITPWVERKYKTSVITVEFTGPGKYGDGLKKTWCSPGLEYDQALALYERWQRHATQI